MLSANKEQRLFSRMQLNTIVILATTSERIQGTCINLSSEGVLMRVESGRCEPGQEWQLVLPSASDQVPPLMAMARVLRVEQSEEGDLVALYLDDVH
ncbi:MULTISPECIES: PilZ domain-containing protein [Oceanimonas]|uniref:PilZ domain-containing protein n=1 Tax=Oceanimonas smirnovii TaxID=264574 RepID=A0ABW7P352_9GAMM|nr:MULTISPECIES: PilZ domain-containing protein [Oceanimonas]MDV2858914.1 PilZ domain-containing protein [Oceanimonas sp. CAM02]